MTASESLRYLRDPAVINYLFKSVYELVDHDDDNYNQFGLDEIAKLVDTFYKSQMVLTDKYGDLFFDILDRQGLLDLNYLQSVSPEKMLMLFRGFAHMTEDNISNSNKERSGSVMQ